MLMKLKNKCQAFKAGYQSLFCENRMAIALSEHGHNILLCPWSEFKTWRADFQNLLHSLLHVTHLQIMSQQRSQFSTQNLLQMETVDTNWN